ncbi:Protein SGT1 [Papilio machaon]|uniref:Protein SGT1 n=1 Tax=Papilio machaon TaxID=76193 RepID=A0A194QP97_PAPMA|nr:Protein SGT1 [Papilio machaon]
MDIKYEDTVQCLFFKPSRENINWDELCQTLNATANSLSKEYIWHRDEFKICQPLITSEDSIPPHLVSTTCFGDNIEDEWFIAYLVFKLTEVHKGLIVQIEDNDGDFLLIEAADFLPTWANPETTRNRVFIYNNHVHIIPPTLVELKTPLEITDALKLIVDHPRETKASIQIENAIHEKIGAYPDRIKALCHTATVSLPVDIAALLKLRPALISHLVFIYNNHIHIIPPTLVELKTPLEITDALKLIVDHPRETKASTQIENAIHEKIGAYPDRIKALCHTATVSLPVDIAALLKLRPALISHLVNTYCNHDVIDAKKCKTLKLDNCIDVSVKFTKFQYAMLLHAKPPNSFGRKNTSSQNKKTEIGYKLSFGFQLIMNQSKKDKFSSPEYNKYLNNLKKNNYFNGNIEGSKVYNQLLEKAQEYFIETESPVISYIYENIAQHMASSEYKALKESLPQNNHLYLCEEESDNWLNVSPDELDDLLNQNYKKQVRSDDLIKPSIVTSGLSKFLSQRSDYEGIEVNEDGHKETAHIQFNSDQFFTSLQQMLDVVTLNDSDEDCSDFSETEPQDDYIAVQQQLEQELASKICGDNRTDLKDDACILSNLVNSMKEEGLSGPTSNIFKSIGIKKSEILDSDDDEIE